MAVSIKNLTLGVSAISGLISAVVMLGKDVNWSWWKETGESLYNRLSDSPTDISGTWQLGNAPMAIHRNGKNFSLDVSPADPGSPLLAGGVIKPDEETEIFVFQGNDVDGDAVGVALWLVDGKTLQGNLWTGGEMPGEDAGHPFQLTKRS